MSVRYEDRISIATPEGIDLELSLAGIGSRFVAALIDTLIQGAMFLALGAIAALAGMGGEGIAGLDGGLAAGIALAVFFAGILAVFLGYPIAFETWSSGRTPGKRWTGLRVVRSGGAPVSFLPSAVRNLVRMVDFLPTAYGVGIVSMLATSRNQRLGDLAAGTLVVQERHRPKSSASTAGSAEGDVAPVGEQPTAGAAGWWPPASSDWATWDLSAVSAEELGVVRRFLERRSQLTPQARAQLAFELAGRLRPKVSGPPEDVHPEVFLTELAAAKSARG